MYQPDLGRDPRSDPRAGDQFSTSAGEIRVVAGAEGGSVRVRILTKRISAKNARASFASSGVTIMTLGAWRKWARSAELVCGAR
jgi:hypothetical protein